MAWRGLLLQVVFIGLVAIARARIQAAQQQFVAPQDRIDTYDAGLFTPVEDLHALSATEYTTLQHPSLPQYSVRIKQSRFCDGEVQ